MIYIIRLHEFYSRSNIDRTINNPKNIIGVTRLIRVIRDQKPRNESIYRQLPAIRKQGNYSNAHIYY